jgi:hypothetical protein
MSDDLEAVHEGADPLSVSKKTVRRPTMATVLLGTVAASLVVLVGLGFAILHEERRQSCAMRWTLPTLLSPFPQRDATQPMTEAQTGWYIASLQCFGVKP